MDEESHALLSLPESGVPVTVRTANEWPSMRSLLTGERPRFYLSDGIGGLPVSLMVQQWFRPIGRGLDALRSLA